MAIPMDVVKPIVESIIKFGQVTRPKLGITVSTIRGTETPVEGALPAGVYAVSYTHLRTADETHAGCR